MSSPAETILPTDQDARLARELSLLLAPLAAQGGQEGMAQLRFRSANNPSAEVTLPLSVLRVLLGVLQEMGNGNGIALTPIEKEFTTQQAADFLRVSRPYLIGELLNKGVLPYRKVGNRRRIRAEDLLRYKEAEEREIARREAVMQELMAETERLGLYK